MGKGVGRAEAGSTRAGHLSGPLYACLGCSAVLLLAGFVGLGLRQPWLFPSLGPTLMMFFEAPSAATTRPVDVLVGHGVGILAGLAALTVFGLRTHPSAVQEGLSLSRVLAAALSLG